MRATAADWGEGARAWARWEPIQMHGLVSVDPTLLRMLAPAPGQRVLDLGCGTGEPTLALAQLVGPRGAVLGIDAAEPMLAVARSRARLRKIANVRFQRGDMGRLGVRGRRFHRVASRFGLMFASDVAAVLTRVRGVLLPGGRAAFAVWGPGEQNPMFQIFSDSIGPFLSAPRGNPEELPHPMRLARRGRLASLMRDAGFRDIRTEAVHTEWVYPTADDYVACRTDNLHGEMRTTFDALSNADRKRVRESMRRRMKRYDDGLVIRCPGFAWVVSGRR